MIIRPMTKTIIPTATEGERERGGEGEGGRRKERQRKTRNHVQNDKKSNSTHQPSLLC